MTVVWFHEVTAQDIERVGGKGANLGEMARAGLPVPRGFCVLAEAYRRMIADASLWPSIQALLGSVKPGDTTGLEATAQQIRALIEQVPISGDVEAAVRQAYGELGGDKPVAVRSSATAEDLPEASFAGQQETYLGVRGATHLLHAIRCCWASLWTGRAVAYRERNGFPHDQVSLSVVVQCMVEPETAGVLFTANPVTGQRDEMLVNAAYGLGESVVSGRVTPDTFRLAGKLPLEIREQVRGGKEIRIRSVAEGGTCTEPVAPADQERLCLDHEGLTQLVKLGLQVEAHYGSPQDIEWAFAEGQVFLLQTRPITTLGNLLAKPRAPQPPLGRMERRVLDDILEHYPDPPFPLDYEAVALSYEQLLSAARQAGVAGPPSNTIIRIDDDGLPNVAPVAPRPTLRLLALPFKLRQMLRLDPITWSNRDEKRLRATLGSMRAVDIASLDGPALADFIARAIDAANEVGRIRFADYIMPMMIRGGLLKVLVRLGGGGRLEWADLLGELDYRTVLIDRALEHLAAQTLAMPAVRETLLGRPVEQVLPALRETEEGRRFLEQLERFLGEHGARTMKVYLPFSNASWREDPKPLLATLAVVLRSSQGGGAEARKATAERYRKLRDGVAGRLPGFLRRRFLGILERFRQGHVARESTLYLIEEFFEVARAGVREARQRLVAAGALAVADHVLFLTLRELGEALRGGWQPRDLRKLVVRRRAARSGAVASWRGAEPVVALEGGGDLKGQPGSPGTATGRVKVIAGPAEFGKLEGGDVLVCPYTDPAWTPLFSLASAVVADTGGPLSHAAIVAREYGIPAVLGTQVGTVKLRDGDTVLVDGTRGLVHAVSISGSGEAKVA